MSKQISRTILQNAAGFSTTRLETAKEIEEKSNVMEMAIRATVRKRDKMIIVGVQMLTGVDFFSAAAARYAWEKVLNSIHVTSGGDRMRKLQQITRLFSGQTLPEMQAIADPFVIPTGTKEAIRRWKKKGYICVLISEGFVIMAGPIKNKIGFDYCCANKLMLEKNCSFRGGADS